AEGNAYFNHPIADETAEGSLITYTHPLTDWLELELFNNFEYSRKNLLNDNGDLLPRERFNATEDEGRLTVVFKPASLPQALRPLESLSLEAGVGVRWKGFEPTAGLPNLDYWELRASAGARYKIPPSVWPDAKVRLRYVYRWRSYLDLPAD